MNGAMQCYVDLPQVVQRYSILLVSFLENDHDRGLVLLSSKRQDKQMHVSPDDLTQPKEQDLWSKSPGGSVQAQGEREGRKLGAGECRSASASNSLKRLSKNSKVYSQSLLRSARFQLIRELFYLFLVNQLILDYFLGHYSLSFVVGH